MPDPEFTLRRHLAQEGNSDPTAQRPEMTAISAEDAHVAAQTIRNYVALADAVRDSHGGPPMPDDVREGLERVAAVLDHDRP